MGAVRIVPDKARQLANGGVRHVLVGIQAVVERADAPDRVIVRVHQTRNGAARGAAAAHRVAVDRAGNLGLVIDLAACVLELNSHSVHVLVKAVQRRLPLAAERRSVQLDRVGILDGGLFHNDLKVVLLFPVAAIAIVCRVVLRCLFRPWELKANRAVRLINHIALRKQKAACQQQNDHQQRRQHTSAAPAPVIAGIALRSARFSCHCPLSPPFFRTPMLPSAKQKINKNLSVFVEFPQFVWLQP